jgi:hypothetical protein
LDSKEPECAPLPSVRSIPTRAPSSPNTGQASLALKISEESTATNSAGSEESKSSVEVSRAKISASRVPVLVLQARGAGFGANTRDSLAWFNRDTSSWKTFQRCLVEDWTPYSETWPRSGMTRNGIAYRLPTLVPLTVETESGSFPTPVSVDSGAYFNRSASSGAALRPTLGAMAKHGLWPTPTVKGNHNRKGLSKSSGDGLATAVKFATPCARDYRGAGRSRMERTGETNGENLPQQIGGPLNPTWVEWLMGFPSEWTALKPSEMPSSRKSSK